MSWLNFNDSLNSIKGQLSSFASGVLADGIVGETGNDEVTPPTKNKIENLEEQGNTQSAQFRNVPQTNNAENANIWSWEPPGEPPGGPPSSAGDTPVVLDLQKKIGILENEKKELIVSLEQLDLDCQQTTDKLVTLKDNLQTSYNELKADYEKLQREYGEVLAENMSKSNEIEILRAETPKNSVEESVRSLQEENQILNTRLMASQKEVETFKELVGKSEELYKNHESNKNFSEEERVKYDKLEEENARLGRKLQEYEEINENCLYELKDENSRLLKENEDLFQELQHLKLKNEELKNVDKQIQIMKSEDEQLKVTMEKLKNSEEDLKKECEKIKNENEYLKVVKNENEKLMKINENLKITNEKFNVELEKLQNLNEQLKKEREETQSNNNEHRENLKSSNENLKIELEKLQSYSEELKKEHEETKKLLEGQENLKINHEALKNDLEKLRHSNEKLKNDYQQLKNENEHPSPATQNLLEQQEKFTKEKEALHEKYLSIVAENMKKYIDSDTDTTSTLSPFLPDEPHILEFAGKVETLLKLLLDFKSKTETLEKQLCGVTQEKNKVIAEKNFEIEKLLKNSEILSQEVITKTQAIKDYEDECGELMKNNDLLISELQNYKNSSGLQTISESNEDNLLLLETQLENANKKIQDMELIISDLENSKQEANLETQTELEYIKKQLNMTGQELSHSKEEYQDVMLRFERLEDEKRSLKSALDKMKIDYENAEYKYTEVNVSMETLKEDNEEYKSKAINLDSSSKKLEALNLNLESKIELLQNVVDDFKQKLEIEVENSAQKEFDIRNLIERLQNSKMCETGLKLQVDTIYKELQTVSEAKHTLEVKYNQSQNKLQELQEEFAKTREKIETREELSDSNTATISEDVKKTDDVEVLESRNLKIDAKVPSSDVQESQHQLRTQLENAQQETQIVQTECAKLKSDLSQTNQQNQQLQHKISFLEAQLTDLSTSRNELVALITAKHQENVQYHGEIQRLNHFLASETEKNHKLEMELHNLKTAPPSIHPPDFSSEELLQKSEEIIRKDAAIEKLTDQNNFLREKCEVLAQNLLQEQSNVQKALSERLSASDKEQSLAKESERLRAHLVEIEDMYTQELLQAEQKNKEMQAKVNEIEQREKDSSSIYTSVSIRANQQVETLQTQLQLVTNQRDELRMKVSDLEDEHNKQVAALTNLQLVLEQFQKEKDKDVYQETERVRRQINVERQIQKELRGEIGNLKLQLEESKQGLQAASRLTDQLEKCKQQIANYKDEVTKLQDQLKNSEIKYKELSTQTDSKVDKTLIKNLVVGYITSHSSDQNQILKIIATVLDFNQRESDKVNLNKPQHGGWLSSILHPQSLNSSQDMTTQQSLSEAFVRFLENESKPKVLPNLLITNQAKKVEGSGSSSSTTPRQSPSPRVLSEVVLPTFVDFGKSRNSSSILKDVLKDNS